MNWGLCVPDQCTNDDIYILLPYAVSFMNKVGMPISFNGIDGVKAI